MTSSSESFTTVKLREHHTRSASYSRGLATTSILMPTTQLECCSTMPSDSNYAAVTKHRRPGSKSLGRPPVLEIVDDEWAADKLSDDEVDITRQEVDVTNLEEGELDADAVVVTPAGGNSSSNGASERRRREEGWNDLGLDQLDAGGTALAVPSRSPTQQG